MTRVVYDFATETAQGSLKENIAKVVPTKLNPTRIPVSDTDFWLSLRYSFVQERPGSGTFTIASDVVC